MCCVGTGTMTDQPTIWFWLGLTMMIISFAALFSCGRLLDKCKDVNEEADKRLRATREIIGRWDTR